MTTPTQAQIEVAAHAIEMNCDEYSPPYEVAKAALTAAGEQDCMHEIRDLLKQILKEVTHRNAT